MHSDRVVAIAGATGGLGRVVTRDFWKAGARLALFSSDEDHLRELSEELRLTDDRSLSLAGDLRTPDAAGKAARATIEKFGKVDVLLNLVGGWTGGKAITEVEAAPLEGMLNQHLWTTFYLAKAFLPQLEENGWGRVVVVSSPVAGSPAAKSAPYAVAKAAQETLVLSLAQEVKGSGITANVIRVKAIDVKHRREQEPEKYADWAAPEEISSAILYLCSDDAGMINGAVIPMYG